MVYVRLEREWTDGDGVGHSQGDMIDVDAATLAKLQAAGIVGGEGPDWPGPTGGGGGGGASTNWPGAT
ncbi:hypothetical protein I0C86_31320 [Plantactinospora sp. S1510]|uniref:Uncharacterized protein n=1 Tax=Plantactinospora alkalitolerans TaxID=2789879 RepID=A0ABS0H4M3_9ACTN|nr:hypothetical protein [Plantactinospora alkalitolerans]MBF9133415.1 hypothetical protein [Plantactinospora alkalitolerans]